MAILLFENYYALVVSSRARRTKYQIRRCGEYTAPLFLIERRINMDKKINEKSREIIAEYLDCNVDSEY